MDLKEFFKQRYPGRDAFLENVVFPIFGEDRFEDGFDEQLLDTNPELLTVANATGVASVERVGTINLDFNPINIFDIRVTNHVMLTRNRVGVQQLVRRIMDTYSSAFMLFHYDDEEIWDWRFSFCSKKENTDTTDSKRFTFLLGPGQSCRTAAENFQKLLDKQGDIEQKDIEAAFDVEALSDEFFAKYKVFYEDFVEYITGKRFVKTGSSWEERAIHDPHPTMYPAFGQNDKRVRDYVKKLLGRIVFLHFLQKKGWLGVPQGEPWGKGDPQFMLHLFQKASDEQQEDFLDSVLEPLFSEGIDTKREGDLYDTGVELDGGSTVKLPYLNGGLFERDELDKIDTKFPKEFFENLLNFFYQYNFTIDENDPNDAQVGVDPEMLGRIFENLLEDNKDKGAYYTPKEIVRYMCQQSLIAYLQTDIDSEEDKLAIASFVKTNDVDTLHGSDSKLASLVDKRLKEVKICDPAIGSGAFPMGLLKELFLCRGAIEDFHNAAEIKRHIIQQNIYGVDIEQGAVDIARLRFWLSMVVDEESPAALPNLDFKIMLGNSLLEQYRGIDLSNLYAPAGDVKIIEPTKNLFGVEDRQWKFTFTEQKATKELQKTMADYYSEDSHTKKDELRKKMEDIVKSQIVYNVKMHLDSASLIVDNLSHVPENKRTKKQTKALQEETEKKEYYEGVLEDVCALHLPTDEFFLWHTWFADVFNRPVPHNGFDIVIGNPPYISAPAQVKNKGLAAQRETLAHCDKFETLYNKWDLYIPFMEMGMKMLCHGGAFSMIVPFPLSNQTYGQKFREWAVANYNVFEIADIHETKIFNNATVSNLILFAQNTGNTENVAISHIDEHREINVAFMQPLSNLVIDEKKFVWNFDKKQLDTNLYPDMNVLGDYCYISVGMVLNADEKSAKGEFTKDDLISEIKDSIHPRPYIEAKDISKYLVNRVRFLEYNTERCPDKLRRPTFRELYEVDKIIMNCLGTINATIDEVHYLHNHSLYCAVLWKDLLGVNNKSISASVQRYSTLSRESMEVLSEHVCLEYLLAILNSKYADQLLIALRGGDYHIYPEHLRQIPIPTASKSQQDKIASVIRKILKFKAKNASIDVSKSEDELNVMIYLLYGLSFDEVMKIDSDFHLTKDQYDNIGNAFLMKGKI